MKEVALEVNKVSKKYRLGERGYRSLREDLVRLFKFGKGVADRKILWALKDISFTVRKGEALGIIGPNGAGKSTLLKILSNVTLPTSGHISAMGKLGALIELTAGFHPELTGRENIYLYGSIKGMKKQEIETKFDEIVAFSGLDKFIDTPIKRYSSGMHARLGFSVSAHIDPDVLIIDEVLSVGDLAFQRKCLDHMSRIRNSDKTVVFVSHNLSAVNTLCDRVIWLDQGEVRAEGKADKVIGAYVDYMTSKSKFMMDVSYKDSRTRWGTGEVRFQDIALINPEGASTRNFLSGEEIKVKLEFKAYKNILSPTFWLGLLDKDENWVSGFVFSKDNLKEKLSIEGRGCLECIFETKNLHPGTYYLTVGVFDEFGQSAYDRIGRFSKFNLAGERESFSHTHWRGVVRLPNRWIYRGSARIKH
jgi:ABC-type polysaccharide/polyol phosphate transport system ATPase subunit